MKFWLSIFDIFCFEENFGGLGKRVNNIIRNKGKIFEK